MKTLTVRVPESLAAEIEAESKKRKVTKAAVIRERLEAGSAKDRSGSRQFDRIADLVGSIDDLPSDLSARTKEHLKARGYGQERSRRLHG